MNGETISRAQNEDIVANIRELTKNVVFHQHRTIFSDDFLSLLSRDQLYDLRHFAHEFLYVNKRVYKYEAEIEGERKKIHADQVQISYDRAQLERDKVHYDSLKTRVERDAEYYGKGIMENDATEKIISLNARKNAGEEIRLKKENHNIIWQKGELQLRWNEYNHFKDKLDKDIVIIKKNLEKEFEKRISAEKRERQREKNKYAADKVVEALVQRNKEIDQEITKLVEVKVEERVKKLELKRINDHEASTAISVIVDQEIADKAKKDRLALQKKASLFSGVDREPRCAEMACTICHSRESAVVYEPCMHVATCIDCVPRNFLLVTDRCQMCRAKITDFKQIFFTAVDLPD